MSLPLSWQKFIKDYLADYSHWFVPKGRKVGAENISIFKSETAILKHKYDGGMWDLSTQESFARIMEEKGFYQPQIGAPGNYSFRAREEKAVLVFLGLVWVDSDNHIHVTSVGKELMESNKPIDILAFQVLKWQFWNPSVRDWAGSFRRIQVGPHLSLLKILRRIQGHSISKDEFCLFLAKLRNDDQIEESLGNTIYRHSVLKQIKAYRNLSPNSQRELIENLRQVHSGNNIFRTIEQDSSYTLAFLTLPPYLSIRGDRIVLTDEASAEAMAQYWETRFAYVPFESEAAWMEFYGDPWRGQTFEEALQRFEEKRDIKAARRIYHRARSHKAPGTELTEEQFIRTLIQEWELEKWLAEHLNTVETGLTLYSDNRGYGRQYPAGTWAIDLLAKDKNNTFVVLELKKRIASDQVFGQLCRYVGWVRDNLAEGKRVRGIIIAKELDENMKYALRAFIRGGKILKAVTWDELGVEFTEHGRDSDGNPIIRVKKRRRRK